MSKVIFKDDTELRIDKVDLSESSEGDNLCTLNDKEGNTLFELNLSEVKYIQWD